MRAVIYARESTNIQGYQRQLDELREYATRMGYEVVKEFSEKVSGAKKIEERKPCPTYWTTWKTTKWIRCLFTNAVVYRGGRSISSPSSIC